jgi:hypothetical protein
MAVPRSLPPDRLPWVIMRLLKSANPPALEGFVVGARLRGCSTHGKRYARPSKNKNLFIYNDLLDKSEFERDGFWRISANGAAGFRPREDGSEGQSNRPAEATRRSAFVDAPARITMGQRNGPAPPFGSVIRPSPAPPDRRQAA